MDALITDRTYEDVYRLSALSQKGWEGMTDDERGEYMLGRAELLYDSAGEQLLDAEDDLLYCRDGIQRGAYRASDLNRVGEAVKYLAGLLKDSGNSVTVSPKTNWTESDTPSAAQMQRYLADVSALREVLSVMASTPAVPASMEGLTYNKANDIEHILADIELLITNMIAARFYSGEVYSGEVSA